MRLYCILLFCFCALAGHAQHFTLKFEDGQSFYADPGAGNAMRTIELWFKPSVEYNMYNPEFAPLVCREQGPGQHNIHEFYLAIQKTGLPNPGHLRFCYLIDQWIYFDVYSDANSWKKDTWYHVACVIHPDSGMMMFIDGIKQQDREMYFNSAYNTAYNLAIGAWGYPPNGGDRYFNGTVDDIMISDIGRYTENFTPAPCVELTVDSNTVACWILEEGSGFFLEDISGNAHHGQLIGGTWWQDDPCQPIPTRLDDQDMHHPVITVRPNPVFDVVLVDIDQVDATEFDIQLIDMQGNILFDRTACRPEAGSLEMRLDATRMPAGLYLLRIIVNGHIYNRKVLKAGLVER